MPDDANLNAARASDTRNMIWSQVFVSGSKSRTEVRRAVAHALGLAVEQVVAISSFGAEDADAAGDAETAAVVECREIQGDFQLQCLVVVAYRKGHRYVTVVIDHETGRLVWAAPGHGSAVLNRFFRELSVEQDVLVLGSGSQRASTHATQ